MALSAFGIMMLVKSVWFLIPANADCGCGTVCSFYTSTQECARCCYSAFVKRSEPTNGLNKNFRAQMGASFFDRLIAKQRLVPSNPAVTVFRPLHFKNPYGTIESEMNNCDLDADVSIQNEHIDGEMVDELLKLPASSDIYENYAIISESPKPELELTNFLNSGLSLPLGTSGDILRTLKRSHSIFKHQSDIDQQSIFPNQLSSTEITRPLYNSIQSDQSISINERPTEPKGQLRFILTQNSRKAKLYNANSLTVHSVPGQNRDKQIKFDHEEEDSSEVLTELIESLLNNNYQPRDTKKANRSPKIVVEDSADHFADFADFSNFRTSDRRHHAKRSMKRCPACRAYDKDSREWRSCCSHHYNK